MLNTYSDTHADVEVSPSKLSAQRAVVVGFVVAVVAVVVALVLFARGPLLLQLGRISGSSRTLAVVVGWSVWGAPLAITLLFARWGRVRADLPKRARIGLLLTVVCLWLPAVALLPGRGSSAEQQFASQAISDAPAVASSLLAGIYAGAAAIFLGLPALALTSRRRRAVAGRRALVARPSVLVPISLLALGGALAFGTAGPPAMPVNQLWPTGKSFTFNGKLVRVLGGSRSNGTCTGVVFPARARTVLDDDGCGGFARGLFTDRRNDALVAVTVIAMPTSGLAHQAAQQLTRMGDAVYTTPLPTPPGYGRRLNHARAATVVEDLGSELVVLETGHADGRPRYVDTTSERKLADAVMSTLSVGIIGI